jgi:hypothetical protein
MLQLNTSRHRGSEKPARALLPARQGLQRREKFFAHAAAPRAAAASL